MSYYLGLRGYIIQRIYCGSFMTALEMAGISLSVLGTDATTLE